MIITNFLFSTFNPLSYHLCLSGLVYWSIDNVPGGVRECRAGPLVGINWSGFEGELTGDATICNAAEKHER